jgi:hypothetical protein
MMTVGSVLPCRLCGVGVGVVFSRSWPTSKSYVRAARSSSYGCQRRWWSPSPYLHELALGHAQQTFLQPGVHQPGGRSRCRGAGAALGPAGEFVDGLSHEDEQLGVGLVKGGAGPAQGGILVHCKQLAQQAPILK